MPGVDELERKRAERDGWPALLPLSEPARPRFPTDCLPVWVGDLVRENAVWTQTPEDLGGPLALATLALAVSRKAEIKLPWTEPLNLYVVVAFPPGRRKSPVVSEITEPLRRWEREEAERTRVEREKHNARVETARGRRKALLTKLARADGEEKRAQLKAELEQHISETAGLSFQFEPRLLASDCTPEALTSLLCDYNGRMGILDAEGGEVFENISRYSANGGANLNVFLRGNSAEPLTNDRSGRLGVKRTEKACLTLGLAVQPSVLRDMHEIPGAVGRGLLARFLFAVPPVEPPDQDLAPPKIQVATAERYQTQFQSLLGLRAARDASGRESERALVLSGSAYDLFLEFRAWVRDHRRPGGLLADDEAVEGWAGKFCGFVGRIAGILHLGDLAELVDPWLEPVSGEVMARAIRLGKYFLPHTLSAFGAMRDHPELQKARTLLAWALEQRAESFSKRAAFEALKGRRIGGHRVEALVVPLEILMEHGFIRRAPNRPGPGPKGERYDLNPKASIREADPSQIKSLDSQEKGSK